MIGQTLSHYKILDKLGAGGMGEVYLAEDTTLKRQVALKVLPADLARSHEHLKRFQREAEALAALNHPNIVTVFSVQECEGTHYLTMELVEGKPLSHLIPTGGMPLQRIFEIAVHLADALTTAHEKGIIHRDLKPANVMVTDKKQTKVLDFGLAKLRLRTPTAVDSQAATEHLTARGHVLGTIHYMSPEQIREDELDQRSDIFSFGIVLYEMVTGQRPFDAGSKMEVASAILNDEPQSVTELNALCPHSLGRIISRCLKKEQADRYQATADLLNDLHDLATSTSSIRVIPDSRSDSIGGLKRLTATWIGAGLIVLILVIALVTWRITGPIGSPGLPEQEQVAATMADDPSKLRLAVLRPVDYSQDSSALDWPLLIQTFFGSELTGASPLAVVDSLSLTGVIESTLGTESPERTPDLYQLLDEWKIDILIDGGIFQAKNEYQLLTNLVDVGTREVRFSHLEDASSPDHLFEAAESSLRQVVAFLQIEMLDLAEDETLAPWTSNYARNPSAVRELVAAYEYISKGLPGADPHLRKAVEADPEFVAPQVWLISHLVQQGKHDEAQTRLQAIKELRANASPFEDALISWSEAYVGHDLPTQARFLRIALSHSPGNMILLFNLAFVLTGLGDCEGAVEAMRPGVEAAFRYPPLYPLWGWCNIHLNQLEVARTGLSTALQLPIIEDKTYGLLEALAIVDHDPASAQNFKALQSRTRKELGQPEQDEDFVPIYLHLAEYCAGEEDKVCADSFFKRLVELAPEAAQTYERLGELQEELGDLTAATGSYERAIEVDPNSQRAYLLLGNLRMRQGAHDEAAGHFRSCIAIDDASPEAIEARAKLNELES